MNFFSKFNFSKVTTTFSYGKFLEIARRNQVKLSRLERQRAVKLFYDSIRKNDDKHEKHVENNVKTK